MRAHGRPELRTTQTALIRDFRLNANAMAKRSTSRIQEGTARPGLADQSRSNAPTREARHARIRGELASY